MQVKARFARTALMSGNDVTGASFFVQAQATRASAMMVAYRFMNQSERVILFEVRIKPTRDAAGDWSPAF